MNPVFDRLSMVWYCCAMIALAWLYTMFTAPASGMGWGFIAADAAVFAVLFGAGGMVLRATMKYALPDDVRTFLKMFILTAMAALIIGCVVGAEWLLVQAIDEMAADAFATSIPTRALICALVFVILVLLWGREGGEESGEGEAPTVQTPPAQGPAIDRITVRSGGRIKIIQLHEVEYLQADGDYVAIVTPEGRWLKEQTMKHFEEGLPAGDFVRIHRSYIARSSQIARIERYGKLYQVVMRGGEKIRVSATGYKALKEKLNL